MTSGEAWRAPLDGVTVLDLGQYLAGPVAALRLSDLGARVIKIERPAGDAARRLALGGRVVDGESLNFHVMNRGKESFVADLKFAPNLEEVKALIRRADVLVHNFRPGAIERVGLGYEQVREMNPRLVYAAISGYGEEGPWRHRPGQDLLAQATSGLPWLSGTRSDPPVPVGTSVADLLTSLHAAHGITALLYRRSQTGLGGLVQTSLLEGMLDMQFELVSAYLTDPSMLIERGPAHAASGFISAPYGVYPTADGYLALAMTPVDRLGELLGLPELTVLTDPATWWSERDRITRLLSVHLATRVTRYWLDRLQPHDVWCAPVLSLADLIATEGFAALGAEQEVELRSPDPKGPGHRFFRTLRSPLRVDGRRLTNRVGSPRLGENTAAIRDELATD
jgi:CoA:oxalate CoA-transferase